MPLLAENSFLPDLSSIPEEIARRAKILWLNYPNNPTGAVASIGFFTEVIEFARQFDLLVAHDAPYTEVTFDGYDAPSILQVPTAKEVAIEFNSFSKAYNMAGWRLGMAVGNPEAIKYIETYKSRQDSAHFAPIYAAGIAALEGDQGWLEVRNTIYKERRDVVLAAFAQAGLHADTPRAALYIWARVPEDENDMDFCNRMLEETNVSTTPGSVFGVHGDGYFRISLVTPSERIQGAMSRMVEWMKVKV
jgi:LL-diaminopimelate aminotransferase